MLQDMRQKAMEVLGYVPANFHQPGDQEYPDADFVADPKNFVANWGDGEDGLAWYIQPKFMEDALEYLDGHTNFEVPGFEEVMESTYVAHQAQSFEDQKAALSAFGFQIGENLDAEE